MANISLLSRLVNGVQRQVDLSTNTLVVQAIQINGTLLSAAVGTGNEGSELVGDFGNYTNITQGAAGATVKGTLQGIDAKLGSTGSGTVTTVSVVSANGFAGTVANPTTTPAITIETTINAAVLAGTGTALIAASLADTKIWIGSSGNLPVAQSLSGDATLADTGALTLATVNSNVGSFGSSTSIPSFTVNAKGLITAASGNAVIAPAGTLTGTTLASNVVTSSLTSLGTQVQALNMGSNQINNVANGTSSGDAVNLGQLQAAINGLTWKGPVQAYSNTNVALTGGATLTIDGYSVQNGDYVILANQTIASQNYVYVASGIGTAYVLTLVTGSEAPTAIGDAYLVEKGTQYGNSAFQVNAISPNVTFIQFAGPNFLAFTSPLSLSGNTVSLLYANGLTVTGGNLEVQNSDSSISVASGGIAVALAASGSALSKVSGLTVNYDGSTIGVNGSNQLYVPNGGIGTTQLAAASVTPAKLGTITDGVTLDQSGSGSTLEIKPAGVSATQLATGAFDQATITGGAGTPASVAYAPMVEYSGVAGQTFNANTTYAVRYGLPSNSETAGRLYAADITTSSFDLFWVVGFVSVGGSSISSGGAVKIIKFGAITLGSADTNFGSTDPGKAIFLQSGGVNASTTAPSTSGQAVAKIGIALSTTSFLADISAPYVY